jgi:transposase
MSDVNQAAELTHLRERVKELEAYQKRWQKPTITLSLGDDQYRCSLLDIGHSDAVFLIECADLTALLSDIRVLRAEVEAWREADVRHDLTRHVMGEGEYHAGEIGASQAATDARGIMTNPLYSPQSSGGEPAGI